MRTIRRITFRSAFLLAIAIAAHFDSTLLATPLPLTINEPVLRQNLVTIDIVDFLQPSATLYWYLGITIFAVLFVQSNTQRAMQFGS
ncbi:MAG TPA: hypothetical protein VKM94_04325 [Blastocatellia bacterium]|nr:hypothetical protein [Blastocatellia bacterium]